MKQGVYFFMDYELFFLVLLPASLFAGATFLVLTDLASRTLLGARQLPVGVVTSLAGAVVFVLLMRARKGAG